MNGEVGTEVCICKKCGESFPLEALEEMGRHQEEEHNINLSKAWKITYSEPLSPLFTRHCSKVCHSKEGKKEFLEELEETDGKIRGGVAVKYDWDELERFFKMAYNMKCPGCGTGKAQVVGTVYQCLHCGEEFIPAEPSAEELEPLYEHTIEKRDVEGALEVLMIKHSVENEEVKERALERIEEYNETTEYVIRKDILPRIVRGGFFLACKEFGIFLKEKAGRGYSKMYMTLDGVKPPTPTEACRGYLKYFSLSEAEEEKVMEIARKIEEHPIFYIGTSMRTICGACIYAGSSDLSVEEIAEKINVSTVGIGNFREKIPLKKMEEKSS